MNLNQTRREYARIMKRSEQTPETFNAATRAWLDARDLALTPANFLRAAEAVRFTCGRCAGTGIFARVWVNGTGIFARVWVNGRPENGGTCFRCEGKGSQDDADRCRNYGYDQHAIVEAFRAMMGAA